MARKKTGISLEDIAGKLDISKNAVSLALNGKPGVSEELRTRILTTASELNYAGLPRTIKQAGLNFLALTVEQADSESQIHNNIIWGIESGLKDAGHRVMISSIQPGMITQGILPPLFKSFSFSGFLLIGPFSAGFVRKLQVLKQPVVLVDNLLPELPAHSVSPDNHEGAWQLATHLIAQGHRRIQFIGEVLERSVFWDRWSGCERALRAAGLPAPFALPARDRPGLAALLDTLDPLPDALFCVNDELALMAIQLLQARGLRVPEDISVVGIDDIQAAHLTSPRLSTYRISWVEMGKEAASLIGGLAILDSQAATTVNRRVHGCLQIRESSRGES